MRPREQLRRARLRRDLRRFSALVTIPWLSLPESRHGQLEGYFTVEAGRIPFSLPVDRSGPPERLEDLDPCRLYRSPDPVEAAALWALSLGFFPVIILGADSSSPAATNLFRRNYSIFGIAALWTCGCTDNELNQVLSSRHVVPCAGIDVAGRIREFYA